MNSMMVTASIVMSSVVLALTIWRASLRIASAISKLPHPEHRMNSVWEIPGYMPPKPVHLDQSASELDDWFAMQNWDDAQRPFMSKGRNQE